ncbi:hypothetical protein C8T65DRAFT_734848 [Cerioporus squamosus]|nr:hypothetical protein C8T65DRAFT_734848 [Cerioporus squamosus]
MSICYQFAEKGTCRFGSNCRFEHVLGAPGRKKKPKAHRTVRVVTQQRPVPEWIVGFFSFYPEFDYDPDLSFMDEFYRMCDYFK